MPQCCHNAVLPMKVRCHNINGTKSQTVDKFGSPPILPTDRINRFLFYFVLRLAPNFYLPLAVVVTWFVLMQSPTAVTRLFPSLSVTAFVKMCMLCHTRPHSEALTVILQLMRLWHIKRNILHRLPLKSHWTQYQIHKPVCATGSIANNDNQP